jgi:hypothetical protein
LRTRRILLPTVLVLLGVLALLAALITSPAGATQPSAEKARRTLQRGHAALAPNATTSASYNSAFTTQTRPHFGSAANGFVVFDEWDVNSPNVNDTLIPADIPTTGRGCARAHLLFNAKRVALATVQVLDSTTNAVVASSSAGVNSNGARQIQLCTGAFSEAAAPLSYFVRVTAAIRWNDNTFSGGLVFDSTRDTNQNILWSAAFGV